MQQLDAEGKMASGRRIDAPPLRHISAKCAKHALEPDHSSIRAVLGFPSGMVPKRATAQAPAILHNFSFSC